MGLEDAEFEEPHAISSYIMDIAELRRWTQTATLFTDCVITIEPRSYDIYPRAPTTQGELYRCSANDSFRE